MKQKERSIYKTLAMTAYILIIASSLLIIIPSLLRPQYNLPGWQMTIGAVACAFFLFLCFYLWKRIQPRKEKFFRVGFTVLSAVFCLLLLYVCLTCRNSLSVQGDYEEMWKMALDLTNGKDLMGYDYLKNYSNNFKPMLFLSVIFRIVSFLRINDPYYAVVFISALQVALSIWAVSYLAEGNSKSGAYRIPVLLSFVLFLPLWANTQAYYTDAMSFGLIVIVLALLKKALQSSAYIKYILVVLAGLIAAVGISVKVTLLIAVIGLLVAAIVTQKLKRYYLEALVLGASVVVGYLLIECWACTYDAYVWSKEISDPIISWIAIGLRGNGSYADNVDFVLNVHSYATKAEKSAYIKEVIAENKSNFFSFAHLIEKIRITYADGTFGAGVFAFDYDTNPNLIWNAFSSYGKYFWRTNQLCFSYIFGIYIILLIGQINTLKNIFYNKMPSTMIFFVDVTLLGVFVFMGIWEANNRQLYNQIPIVLLALVLHLISLYQEYARKAREPK